IMAGLLKAPSRYSPLSNPKLAQERANTVLAAMEDAGYITDTTAGKLIEDTPKIEEKSGDGDSVRYYTNWVTGDLDKLIGTP
ncbi:hypothetical protein, partial [Enterococcus faecalis]|uniref:hypothetical protein n=1 Tax=Enterococcus faecalis TaxID=1351 RepID=UPI003984EDD2